MLPWIQVPPHAEQRLFTSGSMIKQKGEIGSHLRYLYISFSVIAWIPYNCIESYFHKTWVIMINICFE